jgi:hypothetical protein
MIQRFHDAALRHLGHFYLLRRHRRRHYVLQPFQGTHLSTPSLRVRSNQLTKVTVYLQQVQYSQYVKGQRKLASINLARYVWWPIRIDF